MKRSNLLYLFLTLPLLVSCGMDISVQNLDSGGLSEIHQQKLLSIETDDNGAGVKVTSIHLNLDEDLNLFSISRDNGGEFLGSNPVSWELSGSVGSLTIEPSSTSILFKATKVGSGKITARALDGSGKIYSVSITVGLAVRPADLLLTLADPITTSATYVRQQNVSLNVANDANISKWCVSTEQSTMPFDDSAPCEGGSGSEKGWSTSRPASHNLDTGDGLKTLYIWGSNSLGVVNTGPVSAQITLDTVPPATPSISVTDPVSNSPSITFVATSNLLVNSDTDATDWCAIEQVATAPDPTIPLYNDPCFASLRPTTVTFGADGARKVFVFTRDIANNISSGPGSASITYTINTPPVANDDGFIIGQVPTSTFDVLANDTDVNAHVLTVVSKTDGTYGTVTIEPNSSVTYLLTDLSYFGQDTFTYTIDDGYGATSTATVTVDVMSPYTWMGQVNSDWSEAGNWCGSISAGACQFDGAAPGIDDESVFNRFCSSCNALIDGSISVDSINMLADYTGTITQGNSSVITLGVNSNGTAWLQEAGNFVGSSAAMNLFGHSQIDGGSFTATSGLLTTSGNFTFTGDTFVHNSGDFLVYGTGGGVNRTLAMNGASLADLTISLNGTMYINGETVVEGNFVLEPSSGTERHYMGGNLHLHGNATANAFADGGGLNINLVGSGNQTVSGVGSFPTITVEKTTGIATFSGNVKIGGSSYGGQFIYNSGATDFTNSTITSIGNNDFYLEANSPGLTLNHLDILKEDSGADVFLEGSQPVTVAGDLTLNSVSGVKLHGSQSLLADGDIICTSFSGTNSTNSSAIVLSGSSNQTVDGNLNCQFPNLQLNKSGGVASFTNDIHLEGNLTYTAGAADFSGASVNFTGSENRTLTSGSIQFSDVTLNTSSNRSLTIADSLKISGDFTVLSHSPSTGGELIFNGSGITDQDFTVATNQALPLATVKIEGGASVILQSDVEFQGQGHNFDMINGSFDLNGYNMFFLDRLYMRTQVTNLLQSTGRLNYTQCEDHFTNGGTPIIYDGGECPRNDVTLSPATWIGGVDANWDTLGNWCGSLSAGVCQFDLASSPGPVDIVYFDGNCTTNCNVNLNTTIDVRGLRALASFTGSLNQSAGQDLTVGNGKLLLRGGTFNGGDSEIRLNGPFEQSGGIFNSTSGDLNLSGLPNTFTITGGVYNHNNGTLRLTGNTNCSSETHVLDLNSTLTLYNFTSDLVDAGCNSYAQARFSVAAGDVLNVDNNLVLNGGGLDSGDINFSGDTLDLNCSSLSLCSQRGEGRIILNASKNQNFSFEPGASGPGLIIDKPGFEFTPLDSGDLTLYGFELRGGHFTLPDGQTSISDGDVTVDGGTLFHNNGSLRAYGSAGYCGTYLKTFDLQTPVVFNDLIVHLIDTGACGSARAIFQLGNAGQNLDVEGNFTLKSGIFSNGGIINVSGNTFFECLGGRDCSLGGDIDLNFVGSQFQTLSQEPGAAITTGSITVNKNSQELQFLTDINLSSNTQLTTVNMGTVNMNDNDWTHQGDLTLEAAAVLNQGVGQLTVNGTFTDNR